MKVTTSKLQEMKSRSEKITMLTAYDYPTAKVLDESGVDIVLVGDSLGNVILGYENTLPVTMDEMIHHTKAVRRGVSNAMLIGDMPFMSFHLGSEDAYRNAFRFVKEGGVEAVKVEGDVYLDAIKRMVDAGIPVMGHIGFTPQLLNKIGGHKVQGKTQEAIEILRESALKLENAGVFSIVLELVSSEAGRAVTETVRIPTIGIGAGPHCDGQVLVFHDMVGWTDYPLPKFVKPYAQVRETMKGAVTRFIAEVRGGEFPGSEQSY